MVVDAHQHFWNPARIPQPWMTDEHAAIARTFEPPDLEPLLADCGVGQTVLVQSAATDEDTDYMFEVAGEVPGWGRSSAGAGSTIRDAARRRLDELQARPKFRGIRHLIHQEHDPHWILRPSVAAGLALLEERGLLLELPAVYPNHLDDVPTLAARYPGLTIVVDHLGKPPLGHGRVAAVGGSPPSSGHMAERPRQDLRPQHRNGRRELDGRRPAAGGRHRCRRVRSGSARVRQRLAGRSPQREYERVWQETVVAVDRASDDPRRILEQNSMQLYRLATTPVPCAQEQRSTTPRPRDRPGDREDQGLDQLRRVHRRSRACRRSASSRNDSACHAAPSARPSARSRSSACSNRASVTAPT